MSMYIWQCKKCAITIGKDSQPNTSNCPKDTFHQWQRLGEIGPTNYLCDKCSTKVQTKTQPDTSGCPAGAFHHWTKM